MANSNRGKMDIDAVGVLSILCGIAGFAIKTFISYKTNQDLDNQIDRLEATKADLGGGFLGPWRHSEEIRDIDAQISDLKEQHT